MHRAIILALAAALSVPACTVFYSTVETGPDFSVLVKDGPKPVAGLRLRLAILLGGQYGAVTNASGVARFTKVPDGDYTLTAEHEAGIPDGRNVLVRRGNRAVSPIELRWPNRAARSTALLKGVIRRGEGVPAVLDLKLLEPVSGRILATGRSDNAGRFDFPGVAPGLYFLQLKGTYESGILAIRLDPAAKHPELDVHINWSSCGLMATAANDCPPLPVFTLQRLAGAVLDSAGAPIGGARIEANGLQTVSSDSGGFELTAASDGPVQLRIYSPGFRPLTVPVTIDRNGPPGERLSARLGVWEQCGTATRIR